MDILDKNRVANYFVANTLPNMVRMQIDCDAYAEVLVVVAEHLPLSGIQLKTALMACGFQDQRLLSAAKKLIQKSTTTGSVNVFSQMICQFQEIGRDEPQMREYVRDAIMGDSCAIVDFALQTIERSRRDAGDPNGLPGDFLWQCYFLAKECGCDLGVAESRFGDQARIMGALQASAGLQSRYLDHLVVIQKTRDLYCVPDWQIATNAYKAAAYVLGLLRKLDHKKQARMQVALASCDRESMRDAAYKIFQGWCKQCTCTLFDSDKKTCSLMCRMIGDPAMESYWGRVLRTLCKHCSHTNHEFAVGRLLRHIRVSYDDVLKFDVVGVLLERQCYQQCQMVLRSVGLRDMAYRLMVHGTSSYRAYLRQGARPQLDHPQLWINAYVKIQRQRIRSLEQSETARYVIARQFANASPEAVDAHLTERLLSMAEPNKE